ncbi:MAG: DUF7305 domain-containing protein [Bacillota bacterium]
MKSKVSCLIVLTAFVLLIFAQNYVFAQDNITAEMTADPNRVELGNTGFIGYSQRGTLDIGSIKPKDKELVLLVDSSSEQNSPIPPSSSAFDYALFSGDSNSDLTISGANVSVNGDVHSNRGVVSRSTSISLRGTCEAVTQVTVATGYSDFNSETVIVNNASHVDTPDISAQLISKARNDNKLQVINSRNYNETNNNTLLKNLVTKELAGQNNIWLYYESSSNTWNITGQNLVLDKTMYFEGNLLFNVQSVTGAGFIIATGNIMVNGSGLSNTSIENPICVYSVNGDIKLYMGGINYYGIIYAPNGKVEVNSSGLNINGSLISKSIVTGNHGVNYTYRLTSVHNTIIDTITHPPLYSTVKDTAKKFADQFAGTNMKIGFIRYSDDADNNSFRFYNMSSGSELANLKGEIDASSAGGGSNLGDGLRRAYHMLKNGSADAQKYIIVISSSNPNKWTRAGENSDTFKTNEGDAIYLGDNTSSKPFNYCLEIGSLIRNYNIKPFFIDFKPGGTVDRIGQISQISGADIVSATPRRFYDPEPTDSNAVNTVIGSISGIIKTVVPPEEANVTAVFEQLLPLGVEPVNEPATMDAPTGRWRITRQLSGVKVKKVGTSYMLEAPDFRIKVRYKKLAPPESPIVFLSQDGVIKYTFENCFDADGNPKQPAEVHLNSISVVVVLSIDIQ